MSFKIRINYGYGIRLSDIFPIPPARLRSFVCNHHFLQQALLTWLGGRKKIKDMDYDDFEDFGHSLSSAGIASILAELIEYEEHVVFAPCMDFNGKYYLIYPPAYPWEMSAYDKKFITQAEIERIIRKYVSWFTDEEIEFDYQSVESGG